MSDKEFQRLLEDHKDDLKEIFEIWSFIKGLNKIVKWMVFIALPMIIAIYSLIKWIRNK